MCINGSLYRSCAGKIHVSRCHYTHVVPASDVVPTFAREMDAVAVVTDMSPLRDAMRWVREVGAELVKAKDRRPLFQVPLLKP